MYVKYEFSFCSSFNSYCPELHETVQRKKSNYDVINKIKKRNMMSILELMNP